MPATAVAMPLPVLTATRYVTPLREGGSLPALLDTAHPDGSPAGLFVAKFRGAGQGARALVAELIVGLLGQRLGLHVPALALIDLAASFGRTEPDPEIQDILRGSRGLNVGLRYLDGAFAYDAALPAIGANLVDPAMAAAVVWLDALVTNIDRTARNPNLLLTQEDSLQGGDPQADETTLWLIDHGAALYFHHAWGQDTWEATVAEKARTPFAPIRDHVLLPVAGDLAAADARLAPMLDAATLRVILAQVPDALLMDAPEGRMPPFATAEANRAAYRAWLTARLEAPRAFTAEATRAQAALSDDEDRLPYRR